MNDSTVTIELEGPQQQGPQTFGYSRVVDAHGRVVIHVSTESGIQVGRAVLTKRLPPRDNRIQTVFESSEKHDDWPFENSAEIIQKVAGHVIAMGGV